MVHKYSILILAVLSMMYNTQLSPRALCCESCENTQICNYVKASQHLVGPAQRLRDSTRVKEEPVNPKAGQLHKSTVEKHSQLGPAVTGTPKITLCNWGVLQLQLRCNLGMACIHFQVHP